MYGYRMNADARNIVDRIQKKYKCCGMTMWLDWAYDETKPITVTISGTTRRSVRTAITPSEEDMTSLFKDDLSALSSRAHYIDRKQT
ncbi:unnamed protein product [Rotaria sp. Silwood1]|nr:unnamed protein product [Rotaria sp. Silwood1]CAF1684522.1 unnamed protein product [Rotaria sp. Silwood1]CAF3814680.1 unnamed protein product [Rotaria sp. Silwood1]CAF4772019.1 unnamed protein product [Rotaria sp. Silwood1]